MRIAPGSCPARSRFRLQNPEGGARPCPGVALEVDDVEEEMARLAGRGFVMVDTAPCAGARPGMQVAFLYLGKPTGLLVELVQYAERRRSS